MEEELISLATEHGIWAIMSILHPKKARGA